MKKKIRFSILLTHFIAVFQPSRGLHIKALVLLGVCLFIDISESSPLGFDNILNTNALTSAYSSYVYAFNPNDWKSVSFNTTDFAAKAFFGNFLFVASGTYTICYCTCAIFEYRRRLCNIFSFCSNINFTNFLA